MAYDIYTRVSNAQSLVGQTSVVSESSINIGTNGVVRDVGRGQPLKFTVCTPTALTAGLTLTVEVIIATNAALTTGVVVIGSSGAVSTDLVAGDLTGDGRQFEVFVPAITNAHIAANGEQFLGLRYVISSAPAAGTVTAFMPLRDEPSRPHRYAGNYTGP